MPDSERPRVNRWFVAASVLMLLTAAAHTVGHVQPVPGDAPTQAEGEQSGT